MHDSEGSQEGETEAGEPEAASAPAVPERIPDLAALERTLTTPTEPVVRAVSAFKGPLLVVGAGGKMGPTLVALAKNAATAAGNSLRVIAASRFSDATTRAWIEAQGVETTEVDVLDRESIARLPDAGTLIYLVGMKFGTARNPALTWAVNTVGPAQLAERFRESRWVALSTGNVYPMTEPLSGGSREGDPLHPLGEYGNAAVARERVLEYYSRRHSTSMVLLRLNYATELRYGVLVDIARTVADGRPVPLENGYFNCIWLGDANGLILQSAALATHPAQAYNLTAPRICSVREVATRLGTLMGKEPVFSGRECATALVSDPSRLCRALETPPTDLHAMIRWTADWIMGGGPLLDRPTHFEVRDGLY